MAVAKGQTFKVEPLSKRTDGTRWLEQPTKLAEPLVLYFLMMICHPRVQTICVLRTSQLVVQTVRAYDSTKREVMGTLEIELLIGPTTFRILFQVKFIHDGQVVTVRSIGDMFASFEPVLQISHSGDDLFLTGFTFNEHNNTVVLDMMRNMSFLPSMGLGRRHYGSREFIAIPDRDVPFGLGFIPTKLSDGAFGTSAFALAAPSSPDHMSLMTLYFPYEIDEHGIFA
ncbi:hypothetical protein CK203_078088 [Vitis vinifera]|uniref:Uncharacterized protein n=1 Tax=Vitis vinifera TaxID=29760 RepID=A0A438ETY6_VITVI|nr:hypothetical protein CK203_078088 [Vitis vinifera]